MPHKCSLPQRLLHLEQRGGRRNPDVRAAAAGRMVDENIDLLNGSREAQGKDHTPSQENGAGTT